MAPNTFLRAHIYQVATKSTNGKGVKVGATARVGPSFHLSTSPGRVQQLRAARARAFWESSALSQIKYILIL